MPTLGRYELLRPLARGGMAEVFLARRRVGGVEKRLVVKRLRRDHQRDPRFLELFVREAQLSMSLVHQNIVPVFDFGRINDDVFLAMEYIDGNNLGSTLARDRGHGLPPLLAAFVAHECCEALDHAHGRPDGVTHRDVTPRNVLLSWAGEVKLADFGIAAVVGEVAGSFGTPGYMAPEQANALRCDARVDVYALGIVLWEALIGDHVRPTGDRQLTLEAARTGALPPVADTIPARLAEIIERATRRAPDERFAGAREMAEALDAYIIAERASLGGPKPAKQLADWLRARWGDDADTTEPLDQPLPTGGFVTFLDDGADEVRGSRTERSAAMTAADESADEPAPVPVASIAADADDAHVASINEPAPRGELTASTEPPGRAPRGRGSFVAIGLVAAAVAVVVVGLARRDDHATVADAPRPDAAPVVLDAPAIAIDAEPVAIDAEPVATDAAEPDAARPRPDAAPHDPPPRIDAGTRAAADAVPAALRPITIGAIPWAYFTVDDSPVQHETPKTLLLPVGPHRITFTNPELDVSRTVTVEVPADGPARHVEKMR